MKLHKPILNHILLAFQKILEENYFSDKVLEYIFKMNKNLGKRDRQIIAETVYNIIRGYYFYRYISGSDEILKIIYTYYKVNKIVFENEAEIFPFHVEIKNSNEIPLQIKLSYNSVLWNEGMRGLKENWIKEATALNQQAPLVLRTNTLKISREELKRILKDSGIETIESVEVPEALIITNKKFVSQTKAFKKGYYEFQDLSSQKVSHFIPEEVLKSSKRIIDACAGAGGKTLHLSALMKNKGQIIAMDTDEKKLDKLRERAARAGCTNINIKLIDSSKVIKRLKNSADILLLDVPCTGVGTIKRKPDIKIKFSSEYLNRMIDLQRQILADYSSMLKDDGYLLYVTCSILPSENEEQINWFLSNNKNFKLIKQQYIYPSEGFDGFYMCLLRKTRNI